MTSNTESKTISDTVVYDRRAEVAVLTMNNPPVNGLGHSLRVSLSEGLTKALNDDDVKAVIIRGAGKMFCGGADIRQFNTLATSAPPMLRDVIAQIEASSKPVIAAIHGYALGGGLELALGCHYRIIQANAKVGLPEIKLGVIPGSGGTQRLPRLVGVTPALDMILTGASISAARAQEIGIVARIAQSDVTQAAISLATEVARSPSHPVVGLVPAPQDPDNVIGKTRTRLANGKRVGRAQAAVLDCIEAATRMPFQEGLNWERQYFDILVAGTESKSIRHLFFAERETMKVPGVTGLVPPRTVDKAAIIGAGTMGGGIAMAFANAGILVTLVEREQAALDRGLATIRKNYQLTVSKGRLSEGDMALRLDRIIPTTDFSAVANADLVVEAVFEDMDVKKEVFCNLDRMCKVGAILASNTSHLDVNEIATAISRPDAVIGLHFFSPANVMRLLEIVRTERASAEVIATCMNVAQKIGKIPVLVGACEGFVGNRMLTAYWREVGFLLEEGATPSQIDKAMQDFGMAMGPLATADLAGLDISWAARKRLAPTRPQNLRYSRIADRLCELGRFGQKTGAGYYRYEAGSRQPIPDPVVSEIIKRCAREAGIQRNLVMDDEIVERCMFALVNEGAFILEDKIAQRASDIDLVYVNGYGFPAARGGPMFYADTIGLDLVQTKISSWGDAYGEHWKMSALLARLGRQHGRFNT